MIVIAITPQGAPPETALRPAHEPPSSLHAKLQETGGGGAVTSRRRRVTERRRLRRWRWLRQRRHFSLRRQRLRGCCCSSQHPWRGHFSPILAEGRELQPLLQQFEFQFFFSGLDEAGRAEAKRKTPPPVSSTSRRRAPPPARRSLHRRRRPSHASAARRPGPAAAGGSRRETRLPVLPAPERASAATAGMAPGLRSG
ncbi:hypothetical protein LEMLEM_LOCUS15906 [Lemmus lemmus]